MIGEQRSYKLDLSVVLVQLFVGADFAGGNNVVVTFPTAFSDVSSYEVSFAPGTGVGGAVNSNIGFKRLSATQIQFFTANGTNSALKIDGCAYGN